MEAHEAVRKVRELLEARGWCQGEATSPDGRHCIIGALDMVTHPAGGTDLYWDTQAFLRKVLGGSIAVWNDAPGRTFEEVKAKLIEAEEKLKAEGV